MSSLALKIVKLCDDRESREKGLMDFRPLKDNECAFFIFPTASSHPFWNKNVKYPLSLACINDKFEIQCFLELEKESEAPQYPPKRNIKYVIEVNKDVFTNHKIKEGSRVDFDPESGNLLIESEESKYKLRKRD